LYVKKLPKELERKTSHYRSVARIPSILRFEAVDIFHSMLYDVLFTEVRKKRGWAYSPRIYAVRRNYFHLFAIEFGFDVSIPVEEVESVVSQCIFDAAQKKDSFEKNKHRNMQQRYLTDTSGSKVCKYAALDLESFHRIVSIEEGIDSVRQVTVSDIEEVVGLLSRERRWTSILQTGS